MNALKEIQERLMFYQREATMATGGSRAMMMVVEEIERSSSTAFNNNTPMSNTRDLLNMDQFLLVDQKHSAPLKPLTGL